MDKKKLEKILHIDDDDDIRTITKMSLEAMGGYKVISCSSYKEANQKLDQNPDFFIIDVMMPELNGPETLQKIRENTKFKNTPVAFMTAKIMDSEIEKLKKLNVNGIIKKPFDPSGLCQQVQEIWDAL